MAQVAKRFSSVYLFYGEESYLIQQLVNEIIAAVLPATERDFNLVAAETDLPIPELLQLVESAPFFGEHKVVVVKNSKLFQTARRRGGDAEETGEENAVAGSDSEDKNTTEAADSRLVNLITNMPSYTTLIFIAVKADKRRKLVKLVAEQGQVRELNPFRPMEEREIKLWVEEKLAGMGKRMHREAMEHLLAIVGTMNQISRGFLASELEKAVLFAGDESVISKKTLETVMAAVPEVSAFAMTEAVGRRNVRQALARLEDLFINREPPLKIIGLLAFKVRQWWQVRQIIDRRGSEAEMVAALNAKGGHGGMAYRVIKQSQAFSQENLKRSLLTLAEANVSVRSGGDPRIYLEKALIELCR